MEMPSYLGQNFLTDSKAKTYIRDLVLKFKEKYELTHCIEIGPGKWAITKFIQPIFNEYFRAIEKDETFRPILEELIGNNLIFNDVLQVNFATSFDFNLNKTLVYGSLPYYITSPIIGKLFLALLQNPNIKITQTPSPSELKTNDWERVGVRVGIFIVQKEFAEKIATDAKKKSYLWRLLNHNYIVTYHKTIPAKWFSPAPKVDSAIISIRMSETQEVDYQKMLIVLDKISWFKRKTVGKIVKMVCKDMIIAHPPSSIQQNKKTSRLPITIGVHSPCQAGQDNGWIMWFVPPDKEGGRERSELTGGLPNTILKKRIEELSREEMKELVEYLYSQITYFEIP